MRKKQLFAMLLAGTLSIGMAPTSAFAAEEGTTVTIEEGTADVPAEEVPEASTEAPDTSAPEASATPEIPTETPETPTPEATVTPETPTEAPETPTPEATVTPEATITPTPEISEGTVVKSEAELNAAIAAAPETEPSNIILDEDLSLTATVSIPANKNIIITTAGKDVSISRDGAMKGNMFQVEGNFTLQSGKTEDGATAGSITVSGYLDGNKADGAIINVSGGVFVMDGNVTLCDNTTTANGGAVTNAGGRVILTGGTIKGNQAESGGAIYSEGVVQIQGSLYISDNTKTDGTTPDNIALKGEGAVLEVSNVLAEGTKLGFHAVEGKEGQKVIQFAEGVEGLAMEDVLKVVAYEGTGFTLNADGTLQADKPAVTPDVKLKTKPKWLSRTSIEFTCVANVDGWFYAGWGVTGQEAPSFDVNKEGTAIKANKEFKVTLKDLDDKNPITAKKRSLDLDEKTRPGNTTPTPEATATPTPEVSPTATPTPGPTHTPVVPSVKNSVVHGLENPLEMWPNVFYSFSVTGAGSDNRNPGEGDAQWVPQYWMQEGGSSKQTTWKIGSKSGIYDEKTLPIRKKKKKYVYNAEKKQWFGTDEMDYITYEVRTAKISPSGTPGAGVNGDGTGGSDTLVTDPNSSETGSTSSASGAKTADESPVGNMLMLVFASVAAGGYVLVRRRKKETE